MQISWLVSIGEECFIKKTEIEENIGNFQKLK